MVVEWPYHYCGDALVIFLFSCLSFICCAEEKNNVVIYFLLFDILCQMYAADLNGEAAVRELFGFGRQYQHEVFFSREITNEFISFNFAITTDSTLKHQLQHSTKRWAFEL